MMKTMKMMQSGFTLIELVVVIVILGILSAVALPKFIDLSAEANAAALKGVKGAVESASAINYGARKASSNAKGVAIANCSDIVGAMSGGAMPTGYTIGAAAIVVDTTVDCTITQTSGGATATAAVIGV